ncbi:hypothetical protein H4Q32_027825 [Labeo rohita]|uniref:Reverse transcriptase domain-containing protein n=1 Tax=Labeo rohita TaxID=84645 RepID=A0ABQ8L4K4_LABRO|nr:hypothetical protein H4Q32_027825 [Labeo rohita]
MAAAFLVSSSQCGVYVYYVYAAISQVSRCHVLCAMIVNMIKHKISKRKGEAEKLREKKRQALEAEATKCVKINQLFAGRPAKHLREDVSRAAWTVKTHTAKVSYDRATLLKLKERSNFGLFDLISLEPYPELTCYANSILGRPEAGDSPENNKPKWRRGRRGGADRRLRSLVRKGRLTLPIILFANVQSLDNKMDELHARISMQKEVQECSILCFCETWLGERTPDVALTPDGYTVFRADRSAEDSGKTHGGGTAALVKKSWCTDCKITSKSCSENVEFLTLKVFYLPRELQCIIVSVVYIPPSAKEEVALKELHDMINEYENKYPNAAVIILGDFNHCNLRKNMPKLYQFVTFPTRGNKILDQCYSNIKNAFLAEPQSHFGKSDHLAIRLKPTYNKRLQTKPVTVRTINTWTDGAIASLEGCFEATDWNTFKEAANDIHEYTETVSDYISRCTSICAPPKTVRRFPNQKPWFNRDIKQKIRERREAFKVGGHMEYKRARYELQKTIKVAKRAYSQKLEGYYLNHNTRSMWQGIQAVTNYRGTTTATDPQDTTLPDCLNTFYARFDRLNTTNTPSKSPCDPTDTVFQVTHTQVLKALKKVNPHKAAGPDGVPPRVLRACGEQLAGVYTDIFNLSLSQAIVPRIFKSSTIIPVPKRSDSSALNDFRPVALTPVVMMCLEKLVLTHINHMVPDTIDPLQFAYRTNRSVDDATAIALHHILQHLESSRTYVRMLFLDYSYAFNTIRPGKLIKKLTDLGITTSICNWILDFLTDRPQVVRMGGLVSDELTISTGSPQGCCLSPKLFTLYTYDCVSTQDNSIVIKYADDTTILGLITGGGGRVWVQDSGKQCS